MEMNIEPYKYADQTDYNPKNQRKLLLHKGEIKKTNRFNFPKRIYINRYKNF